MVSVTPMRLKRREDVVTDGGMADTVMSELAQKKKSEFTPFAEETL